MERMMNVWILELVLNRANLPQIIFPMSLLLTYVSCHRLIILAKDVQLFTNIRK